MIFAGHLSSCSAQPEKEPLSARSSSSNSLPKPLPCSIVELPDTTSVRTWQGLEAGSLDLADWVGGCLIGSVDGTLTLRAAINTIAAQQ